MANNIFKKIGDFFKKSFQDLDKKLEEKSKSKPCCEKKEKKDSCCN